MEAREFDIRCCVAETNLKARTARWDAFPSFLIVSRKRAERCRSAYISTERRQGLKYDKHGNESAFDWIGCVSDSGFQEDVNETISYPRGCNPPISSYIIMYGGQFVQWKLIIVAVIHEASFEDSKRRQKKLLHQRRPVPSTRPLRYNIPRDSLPYVAVRLHTRIDRCIAVCRQGDPSPRNTAFERDPDLPPLSQSRSQVGVRESKNGSCQVRCSLLHPCPTPNDQLGFDLLSPMMKLLTSHHNQGQGRAFQSSTHHLIGTLDNLAVPHPASYRSRVIHRACLYEQTG